MDIQKLTEAVVKNEPKVTTQSFYINWWLPNLTDLPPHFSLRALSSFPSSLLKADASPMCG